MDVPRYEVNRQVRVVLNRHEIDVTRLDYSFIGSTVYLSGDLLKYCEGDLVPNAIEGLLKEISGLSGVRDVQTDFQNWVISNAGGAWQITKGKKKTRDSGDPMTQQVGAADADKEVHIKTSEKIADVLKDVETGSGQEDR
ncbi:MAG: hypothetical protein NT140_11595 [Deltaproteobacteria bacterium]|nr:hypothetical protein [Deltaproteobacteria bacterium]